MRGRFLFGGLVACVAAIVTRGTALAAPLDEAACLALKDERQALLHAGVDSDRERGAEWGKANLPAVRLQLISRLIAVEEQLSFRCGEMVTARPGLLDKAEPSTAASTSNGEAKQKSGNGDGTPPPKKQRKKPRKTSDADAPGLATPPADVVDLPPILPEQSGQQTGHGD